jgi:hypothetical protein
MLPRARMACALHMAPRRCDATSQVLIPCLPDQTAFQTASHTPVVLRTGAAFGSRARRGAEAPGSAARRPPPRPGCAGGGRLRNGSPAASAARLAEELPLEY